MNLFYLSIAPGIAIMLYIYFKDRYNREPIGLLLMCFVLGVISAIPAVYLESFGSRILNQFMQVGVFHTIVFAFLVVALSEEYCKYFMLRRYAYTKKAFDEPFDGIVYSIMVSMGFATIENVGYVFQHGETTGYLRMFLSVPAHASFAVIMGYFVGLAKFNTDRGFILRFTGIFWAVILHGTYDGCLFFGENGMMSQYVSGGLLMVAAFTSYFIGVRLSLKAIRIHQLLSKQTHEQKFTIF